MVEASIDIEVPFYDVDPMSVVWHGNYLKYFEKARSALLDKIGYNYQEMADSGYAWPIVELKVKYTASARLSDKIRVTARLLEYENRMKVEYLVQDIQTLKKLTKAYSIQVAVDMKTKEMCFVSPDILFDKLGIKR